jgi:sugar-specific transcriptional regulator TrmB
MTPKDADRARTEAVDLLTSLGLSTYAARTYVALVSLEGGTAQDVSDVAEVPRTRVYDAAEELGEWGLVDVQQSKPQRFWAVSTETSSRTFEQEYQHRIQRLRDALSDLNATDTSSEQRGVWTVTGRDAVTERVVEFVESAEREVVFMTVEDLLGDSVVESLRAASDDDVSIRIAGMSNDTNGEIRSAVPGAEEFESLWDWSETPAGRLLMVDRDQTLVSVLLDGDGDHPPEPRDETAVWGSGSANALVVVLRTMFTWELDEDRD